MKTSRLAQAGFPAVIVLVISVMIVPTQINRMMNGQKGEAFTASSGGGGAFGWA